MLASGCFPEPTDDDDDVQDDDDAGLDLPYDDSGMKEEFLGRDYIVQINPPTTEPTTVRTTPGGRRLRTRELPMDGDEL